MSDEFMTAPPSATGTQIGIQSQYPHSSSHAPFGDLGAVCGSIDKCPARSGWKLELELELGSTHLLS